MNISRRLRRTHDIFPTLHFHAVKMQKSALTTACTGASPG